MLVLSRKIFEGVDIIGEINVTVEQISDGDGMPLRGATVQLGFQSPSYVTILRSELTVTRHHQGGGSKQPRRQFPGSIIRKPDATVLLRIAVPKKVPLQWSGQSAPHLVQDEQPGGDADDNRIVHRLICHRDDVITICRNIVIRVVEVKCFQFASTNNQRHAIHQ